MIGPDSMNSEQELIRLTDRSCDGRLTPAEVDRLHDLLKLDLLHYQTCVQFLDMHAELTQLAAQPLYVEELDTMIEGLVPRERHQRLKWMLAASLCVAACLLVVLLLPPQYLTGTAETALASRVAIDPPAAFLTMISAQSEQIGSLLRVGDSLCAGDCLQLANGSAALEFPGGILVRFHGPGELHIESGRAARIAGGTLLAHVPPDGIGFEVHAGDVKVIDYGTEFIVDGRERSHAVVAVRKGKVAVGLKNTASSHGLVVLESGAALLANLVNRSFSPTSYDRKLFLPFDLEAAGILGLNGGVELYEDFPVPVPAELATSSRAAVLIAERRGWVLPETLKIREPFGQYVIPEGAAVNSFLLHYSPGDSARGQVTGSMTFNSPVLGVLAMADSLNATDQLLYADGAVLDSSRGLDPSSQDHVSLSADHRTLNFSMVTSRRYRDQIRVLVQGK